MLQLQNVTKTYKTKSGNVHALDGVSLTFPDSGLVFITGKSGCGKTTLLNVIGGLDGIDSGEILVQDKKFSAFSAAEYDSYRNTFIGFIFQEYNLLPEFTVEKNIKLAMELQGRKADDAEFEKLLKDVEIENFKDRTPSELSGGQRQRVAIARALVKHPRIIMADEPTGALDSGTGIQVLDTLKKLSKNTLVIVVSHDWDFAEKYADRIIHLEDGKVVQDVTFVENQIAANVSEQGSTFVVRKGSELSPEEKDALAAAVKDSKSIEVIESPSFRKKEPTGEVKLNEEEPVALLKSQMSVKSAAQLGLKTLAVKPVRLIFTILISALAFALFGLFDTLANFNTSSVLKNQLSITPSQTVAATFDYIVDYESGDRYDVKISQNAVDGLQKETGGTVKGIFNFNDNMVGNVSQSLSISELAASKVSMGKRYYTQSVNGFIEFEKATEIAEDGNFKDFNYKLVYGRYPELVYDGKYVPDGKNLYQTAISTYLADSIIHYLNGEPLNEKQVTTPKELLGSYITINQRQYKIVGIIDCGEIPEKYDVLSGLTFYNVENNALGLDFSSYINSGAHKCLFVAKGFLNALNEELHSADIFYVGNANWSLSTEEKNKKSVTSYLYSSEAYGADNILLFNGEYPEDGNVTLADDEILVHALNLENLFYSDLLSIPNVDDYSKAKELIKELETGSAERTRNEILQEILSLLEVNAAEKAPTVTIQRYLTETGKNYEKKVKVVGVYFDVDSTYVSTSSYKLMMNKNLMRELDVFNEQGDYCKLLFSLDSIRQGGSVIADYMMSESGLTLTWYNNSVLNVIVENETMIRQFADLFLYADLALFLLSIFMIYSYMSTSIASKKQSVGILRALGAGQKDILCLFLSESLMISVIIGVLAVALSALGCTLVNLYIVEIMNISAHFALFGIRQILLILAVSLLTAIVSSLVPILKISKEKPVELIRRP